METRIKYVVLFLLSLLSISLTAQQKITGVVTGIKGLPLEGVTISKAGSNLGTMTNTDGSFTLSVTLELAMEEHRFFDLVRWGIADTEINAYLQKEQRLRSYLKGASFKKNKNEYFPIPQSEIDKRAGSDGVTKLKQNPGY